MDDALFPNAYTLSGLEWREDSEHVTFEYNQRGHQVYRIIEVDAETGATRAVISEEPETFFDYSEQDTSGTTWTTGGRSSGCRSGTGGTTSTSTTATRAR